MHDAAIAAIREERDAKKAAEDLALKKRVVSDLEYDFEGRGDGAVIRFKKKFEGSETVYTYAAINANGRWYTTGATHPQGFVEEDFILWLASGIPAEDVVFLT